MELTPQLLETQHFPERFRGYDPDAVDDFLERVAVGLREMLDKMWLTAPAEISSTQTELVLEQY